MTRVLLIDNYDSFVYNLAQAFLALGAEVQVRRNDEIDLQEARRFNPSCVCVSPGPGAPASAGVSLRLIEAFAGQAPVLGVCLGHQAIVEVFGGRIARARKPVHGKTSRVTHDGRGVFLGLQTPMVAGRYHSLVAAADSISPELQISARSEDGEIMGVRHRTLAVEGVQFHPESILTPEGPRLLQNFLNGAQAGAGARP